MNKTGKIVTIILWVIIAISAILIVSLMVNITDNYQNDPTLDSWINTNLVWTYVLIIFGAGVAVLAGLYHMITDKRAAKRGLIAIAFLGAVALISYLMASPEIPQFPGVDKYIADGTLNERVSKLIDTGLYATYILFGLAILAIAYSTVSRIFK
jgi:DMSO reductase anchor subunit